MLNSEEYRLLEVITTRRDSRGSEAINQGISVPLLGYEHSFETRGYGHIKGTDNHQVNVGPFTGSSSGDNSTRISVGAAFILGINGYVEFGVRRK